MLVTTLKFAVLFGIPALILAACVHVFIPRWPITILSVLLVVEICGAFLAVAYEVRRQGTGLEVMPLPGLIIGIVVGNLIAIPIAKRVRSAFC